MAAKMAQSSQRVPLGLLDIIVGREGAILSSQIAVQQIVKPTAAEKSPETILATDLDLAKFITFLITDVKYNIVLDYIEYRLPGTNTIEILALSDRIFQTAISTMYENLWRTGRSEIQFMVPSRRYQTGYLPAIASFSSLDIGDSVFSICNEPVFANKNIISDISPVLETTPDCTSPNINQQLLIDRSSPRNVSGWKWALIVSAILSSLFLYALDGTIVASIQPAIIEEFNDVGELSWLGVAFRLGAASTSLIWAKAYGNFNAKWIYILSLFLFEAGSGICGTANTMSTVIIGRAVCGIGGVGLYIGVLTLLSMTTSIRERPNYIASTGIVYGLGTVIGPIIGGALANSWRWAFYINLCLGGLFAPVYLVLLPSINSQSGKPLSKRIMEMDILGSILFIGAFVSGIMAITFGGTFYLWKSTQIIGCFITCGILFIIFGFQQVYAIGTTSEQRIFPVEFLKSRSMVLLFCSMSCAASGLFIPIYMVPLFFQFTRSDGALDAGVHLLPFIFICVLACLLNGAIMSRYGYYMYWYLVAGIFMTIGASLMSIISEHTSASQIYASTILLGTGIGLVLQASFSAAQAIVPSAKTSDAVGFITCAQVTSSTISLAVANSLFLNEAQNRISALFPDFPTSTIQGAIAGANSAFVASLSGEMRSSIIEAIVQSVAQVYILGISAGVFLILLSLGLKRGRIY